MSVLVRDTSLIIKGQGVVASFPDGSSYLLAGEHAAPHGADYNPFFHDPRTGTVRDDIQHMWPMEALAYRMARRYIERGQVAPQSALSVAQKVLNMGHTYYNEEHHDKAHHMPMPFSPDGQLHPGFSQVTVSNQYQGKKHATHERHSMSEDGNPITFWSSAAPHPEYGVSIESGTLQAWRECERAEEELGLDSGAIHGSHIEPGHMTNGLVYRHSSFGAGPGEHVTRPVSAMMNQTRQLPIADPVNILFDSEGKPKLPAAFWEMSKTKAAKGVMDELSEKYGVQDPKVLDAMAHSAIGQLLAGTGRRKDSRVDALMRNLGKRLGIEGENAELFERAQSHTQRAVGWKGRGAKAAVNLAAMLRVAEAIGDDLSDFGSWNKVQPGVVEEWGRVAPMVGEARGASAAHDWGAAIPEQAHASASLPVTSPISEGPAISTPARISPREQTHVPPITPQAGPEPQIRVPREPVPEERAPPRLEERLPVPQEPARPPPIGLGQVAPQQTQALAPTMRILRAMEDMQLAHARSDTEILKHLPTKRNLSVENASDVHLLASRLGISSGDVLGLYASGGDWQRVAKAFQVAPSVVGIVKVAFS